MERQKIIELQTRLTELGYDPGPVDGWYGEKTRRAYQQYLDALDAQTPSVTPAPDKPWWVSRAVIGSGVTIIASLAGVAGWAVDAGALTDLVVSLLTLGFGALAFIGTVKRKGGIRGVDKAGRVDPRVSTDQQLRMGVPPRSDVEADTRQIGFGDR